MSLPTLIVHHPDCALHDTGGWHPERPERMAAVEHALRAAPFADRLAWALAQPASLECIEAVHERAYVRMIEEACLRGESALDRGDTQICEDSFAVARLSAGAPLVAVDTVMAGGARNAFCVARPPGHHAERAEAMGFCLFNNVAVAARHLQRAHGLERVAIFDFDVHHGNGTQDIFYRDSSVFFASCHQFPFYPGTGSARETGEAEGRGATLNIPMTAGAQMDEYREAWVNGIRPALEAFRPQFLLLSAGFDAHAEDPLANIQLHDEDFAEITRLVLDFARQSCDGRVVSLLEGGYNLDALARSATAHVGAMVDD